MTNRKKEVAKFFAGAAAFDAVVHLALAASEALPLRLLGVTLTPALNTAGIVIWASISIILVYYAWMKRWRPLSS